MKTGRGIVAVVYSLENGKMSFLILHRVLNWSGWELLKGHMEKGEQLESAVEREVLEEIGIQNILELSKLDVVMRFFDKAQRQQREMYGFLVKVSLQETVSLENNIVKEHDSFEWVDAKTAMEKLTFENQKEVLRVALSILGG